MSLGVAGDLPGPGGLSGSGVHTSAGATSQSGAGRGRDLCEVKWIRRGNVEASRQGGGKYSGNEVRIEDDKYLTTY
jgi:hypothetical protein